MPTLNPEFTVIVTNIRLDQTTKQLLSNFDPKKP